jgi:hypothetical protein
MSSPALIIEQVALYLGPPWKVNHTREPSNYTFEIIDGTGKGLFFRIDKDRFQISGMFPRHKTSPQRSHYQSIGVNIHRPPQDLAADIRRRLLPDYLTAWDAAAQAYQEEQAKAQHLDYIAQALLKVSNGRLGPDRSYDRTVYFTQGKAQLWSDQRVMLELRNLSVEQAIQVIGLLQPARLE